MILISTLSVFHSFRAIPHLALPYGVYVSQLIRYARCCSYYDDFGYRHKRLVNRLLSQGFEVKRLRNSFKKFYRRYSDLIRKYQRSVKDMMADSFPDYLHAVVQLVLSPFLILIFSNTDFVTWIVTFYQLMLVVTVIINYLDKFSYYFLVYAAAFTLRPLVAVHTEVFVCLAINPIIFG